MVTLVISYSSIDRSLVRAIVSLLKSSLKSVEQAVYWDGDIEPGELWFETLKTHIDTAPKLFVFWCAHSAASAQVKREFLYALTRQKEVIPVLLDDTPLAAELAPIHGLDLRAAVNHRPIPLFNVRAAQGVTSASETDLPRVPHSIAAMVPQTDHNRWTGRGVMEQSRRWLRISYREVALTVALIAVTLMALVVERFDSLPLYVNAPAMTILTVAAVWWYRRAQRERHAVLEARQLSSRLLAEDPFATGDLRIGRRLDDAYVKQARDLTLQTAALQRLLLLDLSPQLLDSDRILGEFQRHLSDSPASSSGA